MATFEIITPADDSVLAVRSRPTDEDIDAALNLAGRSFKSWRENSLEHRIELLGRAVDALVSLKEEIIVEISSQMGRPIAYCGGEVNGFESRARTMLRLAPEALTPIPPPLLKGSSAPLSAYRSGRWSSLHRGTTRSSPL
ncbi:aldehyde dehydrogenase family protein [Neoaquamicrobium sediminum]|uniref:aldehyde dehydrogenase family protein n=1 Tax=Neoaquamicrobium sediminum TaxID=1849104 RepID=UPI0028B1A595|nr:aldehyde dehydrogenase family protein [Mesorhizobium sediminum]